jgi:hypothetical protein
MTVFNDYIMGLTFLFFFMAGDLFLSSNWFMQRKKKDKAKKNSTGAITRFGITSWELLRNHGM